nr:DUF938 domain-containing protein [Salinimonas chungwhensis]
MSMNKPYSQACENNKHPILAILKNAFAQCSSVLEIGSGTGQHAVWFAQKLPFLKWYSSDQPQYHEGINSWIDEFGNANLQRPIAFTVGQDLFPSQRFDGVFTANTAHIMQPDEVKIMLAQIAEALPSGGVFCQYGPFTQQGVFNSQSNEDFHHKLVAQGYGGYRDIDELIQWAEPLILCGIHPMPAHNLLLQWRKN